MTHKCAIVDHAFFSFMFSMHRRNLIKKKVYASSWFRWYLNQSQPILTSREKSKDKSKKKQDNSLKSNDRTQSQKVKSMILLKISRKKDISPFFLPFSCFSNILLLKHPSFSFFFPLPFYFFLPFLSFLSLFPWAHRERSDEFLGILKREEQSSLSSLNQVRFFPFLSFFQQLPFLRPDIWARVMFNLNFLILIKKSPFQWLDFKRSAANSRPRHTQSTLYTIYTL